MAVFLSFFSLQNGFTQTVFPEYRAVWLSRDVVMQGRESMRIAFKELKDAGLNTVFVNVWYMGGTIYPSQMLAEYGGLEQLTEYAGWDPLAVAIEEGHRIGLEVHAWFEYGLVAHFSYSTDAPDPGPVFALHPDWLMHNREGDNYKIGGWGNYQFWLDPAHPQAREFMVDLFSECASLYPDLDGIQTDRIRYPGIDYSYSEISRNLYQSETGGPDPLIISASGEEWENFVQWRESKVNLLANEIYQSIKAVNPQCLVSAAVGPPYMLEGASDVLQDWPAWFREGSIDLICPMLYGLQYYLEWIDTCLDLVPSPLHLCPGISLEGNISQNSIDAMMTTIRDNKLGGTVIWYLGYLNPEKRSYLHSRWFTSASRSLRDRIIVDNSSRYYVQSTDMEQVSGGIESTYLSGNQITSKIHCQVPLFISGTYHLFAYIPESLTAQDTLHYSIEWASEKLSAALPGPTYSDQWYPLGKIEGSYADTVWIEIRSPSGGKVLFDAIDLRRYESLSIEDAFIRADTLSVLFNRFLDVQFIRDSADIAITPLVDIRSITIDIEQPAILQLNLSGLQAEQSYTLVIRNLLDMEGNYTDSISYHFVFSAHQDSMVDDSDELFTLQSGDWTELLHPKAVNGACLLSECGNGNHRVFWRYQVPESGYYCVRAYFPDSSRFASDAMYILKHGQQYDTLRVNQQESYPDGYELGTVWMERDQHLVVKLHNDSQHSADYSVAADAVAFSRAFRHTSIDTKKGSFSGDRFRLSHNYPNPFNSRTLIPISVKQPGIVFWEIFDLRGRKIMKNQMTLPQAGTHQIPITMSDYSSGIYYYRVLFEGFTQSGKMLYLR